MSLNPLLPFLMAGDPSLEALPGLLSEAKALGLEGQYGTLEPGKKCDLLAVPMPSTSLTEVQVYDHLVTTGSAIAPTRIQG